MKHLLVILAWLVLLPAAACARDEGGRVYDETADAASAIDAALAEAGERSVNALLIFGTDACHDSRGLAVRLTGGGEPARLARDGYALAFIDVGERERNLDQLARFGVAWIFGTPTVLVVAADGSLLNGQSVHDWRLADSTSQADLAAYLAAYARSGPAAGEAAAHGDVEALAQGWAPLQTRLERIEAGESGEAEKARQRAYALGYARSRARAVLGDWQALQGPVADSAALDDPDPERDRTDALAALMAGHDWLPAERFTPTGG